ncbi:MAG TPA: ACT domain-containing protein [Phycisphaerae bacterium]|nr:ACT domain-containing protein [Phycisphaerae bacterium]HUU83532.1 ACT domain-containing protein [Phycisphaerae bacterium]
MAYTVKKVEVWAIDVQNRPGTLARILEGLTQAGAQLEFVVARQVSENTSRVFLSPLKGKKQKDRATELGLRPAAGMSSIRIDGPDRAGLGCDIARAVAANGINIRGASAAVIGRKMTFYLAFKTANEAVAAAKVIRKALRTTKRKR